MTYPTAYRSGTARSYGSGRSGFQNPAPTQRPRVPNPARRPAAYRQPVRLPSSGAVAKAAAVRLLSRRVPYLGWALQAVDLWNAHWQHRIAQLGAYGPRPDARWEVFRDCGAAAVGPWSRNGVSLGCGTNSMAPWEMEEGLSLGYTRAVVSFRSGWRTFFLQYQQPLANGRIGFATGKGYFLPDRVNNTADPKPVVSPTARRRVLPLEDPLAKPRTWIPDPALIPPGVPSPEPAPPPHKAVPRRPLPPNSSRGHDGARRSVFHRRTPPPRGTKERKLRSRAAAALALKGVHVLSEALDVLDAFWNALPKDIRRRYGNATPQKKAQVIYDNYSQIDMSDLMFELLWNHYSDKYIGKLYGKLDQWGRNRNITWGPYGPGGPWSPSGKAAGELIGQVKNAAKRAWDGGEDIFAGLT